MEKETLQQRIVEWCARDAIGLQATRAHARLEKQFCQTTAWRAATRGSAKNHVLFGRTAPP